MWLYSIILLQLIVVLGLIYVIVRKIYSSKSPEKTNIEKSVKEGVKSAIKELEMEKEEEENLLQKLDQNKPALGVFSLGNKEEAPINSGGELIPANLSDSEKELLRMFYGQ